MEAVVAHYADPVSRYEAASTIRHEIRRRMRSACRTSSTVKVCPSCATAKTFADFTSDASRPDGLDWRCRSCRRQAPAAPGRGPSL